MARKQFSWSLRRYGFLLKGWERGRKLYTKWKELLLPGTDTATVHVSVNHASHVSFSHRFLPGFAPFIDGTVIVNPINIGPIPLTLPLGSSIVR